MQDLDFQLLKTKRENFYKNIKEQHCPYFKTAISFNNAGLNHIYFKSLNKARSKDDQIMRLKLLKYVPEIIRLSGTVQGITSSGEWEKIKSHGIFVKEFKNVTYYEFISVMNDYRIKVVVKRLEGGELHFWSVIPFWDFNNNIKQRRLGDLDNEDI